MFKVGDRVRCVISCTESIYRVKDGSECVVSYAMMDGRIKIDECPILWESNCFVLADDPKQIMVPVDPACVPDGHETVRYEPYHGTKVNSGESVVSGYLIVRKKYVAHISIPKGWWVYPVDCKRWFATDEQPVKHGEWWISKTNVVIALEYCNFTPPEDGQPRQVS